MSFDFYRKERPEVFNQRFIAPAPPTNAWTLSSNLIFQARRAHGTKNFRVTVNAQQMALTASVMGNDLFVVGQGGGPGQNVQERISEREMGDLLEGTDRTSLRYQIAKKLCQDHATSSASSPFISGCVVDNFAASRTFNGCKLHLKLRSRRPFRNPFVSGLEQEYFLIGQVADTDCTSIIYLGTNNENLSELVNPFGSGIPRPAAALQA